VFPFLHTLGGDGSTYDYHMKDARFTRPTSIRTASTAFAPAQVEELIGILDGIRARGAA
jgi:hypothetical protein